MAPEPRREKRSVGMKKLITKVAVGLAATACVAGVAVVGAGAVTGHATTATTTTTLPPPVQGNGPHHLFFYVDTVQGGGGTVKLPPNAACSMSNLFLRGEVVVFRMFGVHITTGGNDLTNVTVKYAYVTIPGVGRLPMSYGSHGTVSFWSVPWGPIAKKYPLGVVNFVVTVVTNPVPNGLTAAFPSETGYFTQKGMPSPSQLTIIS